MIEPSSRDLLDAAKIQREMGDVPSIIIDLCGDFAFDQSCPVEHARKVAVAAYLAGQQSST
jgi:hypothetical protein